MDSHILCGGGALAFSAIMASLLQGSKPLRAQAIIDSVPDVDRVSVRVISSFSAHAATEASSILSSRPKLPRELPGFLRLSGVSTY